MLNSLLQGCFGIHNDFNIIILISPRDLLLSPRFSFSQALVEDCKPGLGMDLDHVNHPEVTNGNLVVTAGAANEMTFTQADTKKTLFSVKYAFGTAAYIVIYVL